MAANNGPKPELIIATGSPFVSFLAIKHFASRHQVPYILDYRDLWSNNPHFNCWPWLGKVVSRAIEKAVNPNASFITTVSQSCADVLCADNAVHVLYNYPDRAHLETLQNTAKKSHDDGKYHIVYAGTLYEGRTLAPVARAIAALPPIYRNRIVFDYCGNSGSQALADFRSAQIEKRIVCHGMLSKQEANELVACAQLCISVIHNERYSKGAAIRGIMSTKIFDYLALGKPVVNIAPEDNELTLWLQRHSFSGVDTLSGDEIPSLAALLQRHVSTHAAGCDYIAPSYPEDLRWETQFDDFHDRLLWGIR